MSQLPEDTGAGAGRPLEPLNTRLSDGRDLEDSPHDLERMNTEETIIDMPDVSDIPGQEHVKPPRFGELSDVTLSSDDEEGDDVLEDEDDDIDLVMGTEADTTSEERELLEFADIDMPCDDDMNLRKSALDSTDQDGEPLNEGSPATDISGGDLDTSGVDSDDPMESIGEEDEENNTYSLGSSDNDQMNEGTP